jgi:acetyltransferase
VSRTQLVTLREAREIDEAGVAELLAELSPQSAFHRFMGGVGAAAPELVRALLATGDDRGAWLALDATGRTVGHACWMISPGGVADIGVLVADAAQGRGIGTDLFTAAVRRAADAGARAVHLDVHPENRRVAGLLRRRLGRGALRYTEGLLTLDAPVRAVLQQLAARAAA